MAMTPSELINKYATLRELYYGLPVNGVWERRRIARQIYFWLSSLCLIITEKYIYANNEKLIKIIIPSYRVPANYVWNKFL